MSNVFGSAATVPCPVGWRTSRMFPDVPVSTNLGDDAPPPRGKLGSLLSHLDRSRK